MLQNKPKRLFYHAKKNSNRNNIYFNSMPLNRKNTQKHLGFESTQYNAALAITGAIKGTSREKLYQELGLESLKVAEVTLLFA